MSTFAAPVSAPARPWPAVALAAVCGLLLGVAAITAVGAIGHSGRFAHVESPQSKALKVLRPDRAAVVSVVRQLDAAKRVADLRTVGHDAQVVAERLRIRDAALLGISDTTVQATAQRAHRADIQILTGIAGLADVDAKHLDGWDSGEEQVVGALGDLDAVAAPVAAMDTTLPLRIDSRPVEASVTAVSAYLTSSAQKLARYEKRMAHFRAKNRHKLQAAANYRATVNSEMAAYGATRHDLQLYINDAQDFNARIPAFRSALQDARSNRQSIRGTLASMTPPPALTGEHNAFVAVLDKSIAGTEAGVNLADATQVLRDNGDGSSGFTLPEYDRFTAISDEITHELGTAAANWNAAITTLIRRLKHPKGAPHKPRI